MNEIIYIDNDPTKPVMYIGVIFFYRYNFENNKSKTKFLLLENNMTKYEDIGIDISISNNICDILRIHTNYLIDLTDEELNKLYSKQIYISQELALIKFIHAPENIINLKYEDFGTYTVLSNDNKIKRRINWIDKDYIFKVLSKFNKLSKKLHNKEIMDMFKNIEVESNINSTLKSIHKSIHKKMFN
jgi:hypothetical protein